MSDGRRDRAEAEHQAAFALHQQGRLDEARAGYLRTLELEPQHAATFNLLGVMALQNNQLQTAIDWIGRALLIDRSNPVAYINHASACSQLGRHEAALASYDAAIALNSECDAIALYSRGNALNQLKRHAAAVESYDRAIALQSDHDADAYYGRGIALHELGQYGAAAASYEQAIALESEYEAEAYFGRAVALQKLDRHEEAVADFDQAIALQPDYAMAHKGRGVALGRLARRAAALESCDRAIALAPGDAEAHNNRGIMLSGLGQAQAAVASFTAALGLKPDYAEAWRNRGVNLIELGEHRAAIADFEQALAFDPAMPGLAGMWLGAKAQICDWRDFDPAVAKLNEALEQGRAASPPFNFLALSDSPAPQLQAAKSWGHSHFPAHAPRPQAGRAADGRIRIGYFSADFREHATLYLMAGLFEQHDRSQFDVTAFSMGPATNDAMARRLKAACRNFIDIREHSDRDAAGLARELGIDLAIDLNGYTQHGRPDIFAWRAAPLQVSYLGYPGTMGVDYVDYLIADRTLIPAGSEQYYTEKIAYLPHSYQVNDSRRAIAPSAGSREQLGLPREGFVFCCFNNSYKIKPGVFDLWMRILQRVAGSVLWLFADNAAAETNLRQEATRRGVSADRLIFAPRMPLAQHLARQRAADLFLDTLPYTAHTTASDALWAGLPVLTCPGRSFAGRVAASLLAAIEVPELIAATPQEYEALAVALAQDPQRLAVVTQRLAANRTRAPLFDTRLSTRHLESAYSMMVERQRAGLSPEHLFVAP